QGVRHLRARRGGGDGPAPQPALPRRHPDQHRPAAERRPGGSVGELRPRHGRGGDAAAAPHRPGRAVRIAGGAGEPAAGAHPPDAEHQLTPGSARCRTGGPAPAGTAPAGPAPPPRICMIRARNALDRRRVGSDAPPEETHMHARTPLVLVLSCLAAPASAQYTIPWHTIDGGGGTSSGGGYTLS